MMRASAAALGFFFVLAGGALGVRAAPTWEFVETSCISVNGGCKNFLDQPLSLPAVVATFSSPDISGQYQFDSIGFQPPIESGDPNFTLQWPVIFAPPAPCGPLGCELDIAWDDGPPSGGGSVAGFVYYDPFFDTNVGIMPGIGSDDFLSGCGFFAQCGITGYWAAVPEVDTLSLLCVALGCFVFVCGRCGGRNVDMVVSGTERPISRIGRLEPAPRTPRAPRAQAFLAR